MHPSSLVVAERGSTGPQDLVLIKRAMRGDRDATEQLLQRLSCIPRFVFRLNRSLGMCLPADALEDVVQQVYASVWPRLADFVGSAAIESWVFGFCRNCLRAQARKRRQSGVVFGAAKDVDADDSPFEPAVSAAPDAERSESVELLRDELARLEADERAVVEMRFLDELSFEQIARVLDLPASTVKDRCYRAMTRLKGRLQRRDRHA